VRRRRAPFDGYEMPWARPLTRLRAAALRFDDGRLDGAVSRDGLVSGVYVHGLFAQRSNAPSGCAGSKPSLIATLRGANRRDAGRAAEHIADHVDLDNAGARR